MPQVHRVEVRSRGDDPRGAALVRQAGAHGLTLSAARSARVYLIEADLEARHLDTVVGRLLADPVTEVATVGASAVAGVIVEVHPLPGVMDPAAQSVRDAVRDLTGQETLVSTGWRFDLSGIDEAGAARLARAVLANPVIQRIHTEPYQPAELPRGHAYTFVQRTVAIRRLGDADLERLSRDAHLFLSLEEMRAIRAEYERVGREPTDIELETLAQTWSEHCVHKTMKSRVVYRAKRNGEPAERRSDEVRGGGGAAPAVPKRARVEIGFTFTPGGKAGAAPARPAPSPTPPLPSAASLQPDDPIDWSGRPGHMVNADGSVTIDNLLRSTVAAATRELVEDGVDWTLSVFKDNSGVIAFDGDNAVCVKVETHNHPSAIEPYGGAATGIGGCIRDVIGTGLGARPIASTDVFCVAPPGQHAEGAEVGEKTACGPSLPPGCLPPRRVLSEVVAGVRDYGNRMGIPTVSGAVAFDERYVGNPLVFCGCVGVMPRDRVEGRVGTGDRIIALGGRTGRDGIHGATFSSAEMEATHADEFAHAVQIGNAIEEKRVLDAILRARDGRGGPLFTALTDCGAGGFSSAVGEMGRDLGAEVHLDRAPLKYDGLSYTEIWISEAQERMVLAVPPGSVAALRAICEEEHVEIADLGHFGTASRELILHYKGTEVGRLDVHFLHEGLPQPTREAVWAGSDRATERRRDAETERVTSSIGDALVALLRHPNIASKHWIIRQYDHEVRGATVLKPLVGPGGRGPGDAAVIEPVPGTGRGLSISCGLATGVGDPAAGGDPYLMALAAIDECVRNLVCVGTDPRRIAILDNFCWPSCGKPENLGSLVRAAAGCYDGAKAFRTPFVSGKDSLNNQLRYTDPVTGDSRVIEIPPTLLITGIGIVPSLARVVTMDAKQPGNVLLLIGETTGDMGGSHYEQVSGNTGTRVPRVDLAAGPRTAQAVAQCMADGLAVSAHDCSDGGMLVAVAEMLIATTTGAGAATLDDLLARPPGVPPLGVDLTVDPGSLEAHEMAFSESPSRYVLEVRAGDVQRVRTVLRDFGGVRAQTLGALNAGGRLVWQRADLDEAVRDLAETWLAPLDW
ncbi:MAG: phosphoribosylformylglycinamidine synthase subunit PurL [Phycisphaerales bacterium]|nr:phosphoribosylformylglycinamidine synthase subunit PurL [Phycisphaerales bacterium]